MSEPSKKSGHETKHDAPLHKVMSYLTVLELIRCFEVSKQWHTQALLACKKLTFLDLSQFWAVIGDIDISPLNKLCQNFESITSLSMAYCQSMKDADLLQMMRTVCEKNSLIVHLNIFYCLKLTDKSITKLLRMAPNLVTLNLGHCHGLTNQSVKILSNMTNLETLILKNNQSFTDDILMNFESSFPALARLDLQCTRLDPDAVQSLRDGRAQLEILGPKNQNLTFSMIKIKQKRKHNPMDTVE
eukprot:69660_1